MKKTILKVIDAIKCIPIRIYGALAFTAIMFSCMASIFFSVNVAYIEDENGNELIVSLFDDYAQILTLAEKEVGIDDKILYTSFSDGRSNLTITRAFSVNVTADGKTQEVSLSEGTVKDCLDKAGVILGEHDYTEPSLNTPVIEGDEIRVFRVEYMDNQYSEAIPYETEYRSNSLIFRFKNNSYVLTAGQEGENLVTYRERYVDGELDYALVSNVELVKKPVNELVLTYSPEAISPLPAPNGVTIVNGVPSSYSSVISNVAATGYYSATGKGSSGLGLFYGSVAVNPNVIPYGSHLYITSPDGEFVYGFAIATDTGTALMEGIIGVDLFYETYKESSLNWKNTVNIYIL